MCSGGDNVRKSGLDIQSLKLPFINIIVRFTDVRETFTEQKRQITTNCNDHSDTSPKNQSKSLTAVLAC